MADSTDAAPTAFAQLDIADDDGVDSPRGGAGPRERPQLETPYLEREGRKRVLVVGNCQATSYAEAVSALLPTAKVIAGSIAGIMRGDLDAVVREGRFDHALVTAAGAEALSARNVALEPDAPLIQIMFSAFHPDMFAFNEGGAPRRGVLNVYHSMLAVVAHERGLGFEAARALFRREVYERAGYFDLWTPDRRRLFITGDDAGYDLRPSLARWSRKAGVSGAFMHIFNHPVIEPMVEISRQALRRAGLKPHDGVLRLIDPLLKGTGAAVFPEVATRYGVPAEPHYRLPATTRTLTRDAVLEIDLAHYAERPIASIETPRAFDVRLNAVREAVDALG